MWNKISKEIKRLNTRIIHPYNFKATIVHSKKGDIKMLVYNVTAGQVVDSDVAERRLSVSVNGEVVKTTTHPSNTTSFGELSFADNDRVVLTLVDVDDAGNSSSPATYEFVALDTIPPATPGEFGVTLVREE
ncbi:hypothetical protein EBZ38_07895 [bacterium]|nr:hypothetical protein [bacterium]